MTNRQLSIIALKVFALFIAVEFADWLAPLP
jgi:hypothetical protein